MTRIKICGITTLADGMAAVEAGADLLGFNFYPKSSRYIEPRACARLVGELRDRGVQAITVGVFVNTPPQIVAAILDECGLDVAARVRELAGAGEARVDPLYLTR